MIETEEQAFKVLSDYGLGESLVKQGIQALEENPLLRGIQRIYPLGKGTPIEISIFNVRKMYLKDIN